MRVSREINDELYFEGDEPAQSVKGEVIVHFDEAATGVTSISIMVADGVHLDAYRLDQRVTLTLG